MMKVNRGFTHRSRRKTPWDKKEQKTAMQEFLHKHYKAHYNERHPLLSETGEAELINSYTPKECPHCANEGFKLNGYTSNDVQRYKCSECKQTFTPVTRTIFEGHKISLSEWIEYTLNIFRYLSINADSWNNRNAFTTSRYWLEKLFLLLESYRQNLKLSGKIWLDETFYRVRSEDVLRTEDGGKLHGLSSNQMCIGVACDKRQTLCIFEGFGKPSQKKTFDAFKDHIEHGSVLIHDKENAHKKLVSSLQLKSIAYDSREIKHLSDKDNPLYRVNHIHNLLKSFLYAHTSFNRDKLQGYLNVFSFVMNPPSNHLEKAEVLLDLAFKNPITLRYREFYGIK
jgi:transposase-like protein